MSTLLDEVLGLRAAGRVGVDLTGVAEEQVDLIQKEAVAPSWVVQDAMRGGGGGGGSRWLRPVLALGSAAAIAGGAHFLRDRNAPGVEEDVINRFRNEFLAANRSEKEWAEQGVEERARKLMVDLKSMAPDVAANASMALSAIRSPALRRMQPNFTNDEVKDLIDRQKAIRETRPAGSRGLETVRTVFSIMNDAMPV